MTNKLERPHRAPSASPVLETVAFRAFRPTRRDFLWKGIITAAIGLIIVLSIRSGTLSLSQAVASFVPQRSALSVFWFLTGSVGLFYSVVTLYYALRYRPVAPPENDGLPTVTVVVPAYNEGMMVRVSLLSALANGYPREKLHVIAVDDGSTDDTWEHIQSVARANPEQMTAVRLAKNGGKREALREGFSRARGEIVVTVDSDSKLDPDALRQIVAPLVADPEVGTVAGKVLVLNRYESMLTRLLAARFFITFDFTRAVQSRFGAVLCCPGALTAYRRAAVMKVLDPWSTQTFMGSPCTIGEDRALTTWLLKAGYRSVYQASGIVHTIVPTTVRGVVKMLLRWERGNVRENLVLVPMLATKWRTRDRWWPTFEVAFELLQYPIGYLMAFAAVARFAEHPLEVLRVTAGTIAVLWLGQSLCCLRSERSTDFVYNIGFAFFALVGLQWVFPYSVFTVRDGRWMTR